MTAPLPGLDDVGRFRGAIARQLGLHLDESKHAFLAEVLQRRADAHTASTKVYLDHIDRFDRGDPHRARDEVRALAQELTIGETYFFRHHEQFQAFADVALPARVAARAADRTLRLLSAGCASGEEAYTLAIVVRERHPGADWRIAIRAADVNAAALERAAGARFSAWSLRETPPETQRRWFASEGREFVLDPSLRGLVTFDERNLADAGSDLWPPDFYDVIFCRNVMMYFTADEAQALVGRLTAALAPGGFLFLGHAETLRGLSNAFHLCHSHDTFYYQRKDEVPGRDAVRAGESPPAVATEARAPLTAPSPDLGWFHAVSDATSRIKALVDRPPAAHAGAARTPPRGSPTAAGTALELLKRERFSEALSLLDDEAADHAADADALLLRAVLLTHGGQLADAEAACARLLAIDELSAGAHYVLAQCRDAAGDRKAAREHDQAAVYLDPTFAMPRLHLGLMARRLGDRETAQRELEQAERLLSREEAARLLLFGGGFTRDSLIALCRAERMAAGGKA